MSRNTYIITFDSADPAIDTTSIKERIRTGAEFINWWNHIPLVFLVTSELDADAISDILRPYTNASFLVMRVLAEDSDGALPPRGWEWIKRHSRDAHHQTLAKPDRS